MRAFECKMNRLVLYWHLPGQRIIKTSAAVTLCLLFYMFIGFRGAGMPAEAAITAIICMQSGPKDSTESGLSRLWGTMLGAMWGFLFLLAMALFPALGSNYHVLYLLMGLGTLISLHSAVLIHRPDVSGLAAIVFICVVISYPSIDDPLKQAFLRIFDVLVGSIIAVLVNSIRLSRVKYGSKLFFVPLENLSDSSTDHLSLQVLFRLQYLFQKGARICLVSRHAPAFPLMQINGLKFTVPMIVMDGAAIFDPNENEYLSTTNLNPASCRWLMKRLENRSYFISTVHRDRNCIYHHGALTQPEDKVYRYLKRSPYRYYLDDDRFSLSDVVYLKVVTTRSEADRLQRSLEPTLPKMKLRSVIRPQAGLDEGCSLYFYAADADIPHAMAHLTRLLRQKDPAIEAHDLSGSADRKDRRIAPACERGPEGLRKDAAAGHAESEAIQLLRKVDQEFEPLLISDLLRKKT